LRKTREKFRINHAHIRGPFPVIFKQVWQSIYHSIIPFSILIQLVSRPSKHIKCSRFIQKGYGNIKKSLVNKLSDRFLKSTMNALFVIIGGGVGALLRYVTSLLCIRLFGAGFPLGTILVNLLGCFLIGVAMALAERGTLLTPTLRLFFVTGFLGGFTTFSTYAWESVHALRSASFATAAMHILVSNIAGIGLVFAGFWSAKS
jgi:CrcB protein